VDGCPPLFFILEALRIRPVATVKLSLMVVPRRRAPEKPGKPVAIAAKEAEGKYILTKIVAPLALGIQLVQANA
jgi:hypothetical protein